MAVAFRSSSASAFATAVNITATEPASAALNDILRADLYIEGGATVTAPSGWSGSFNGTTINISVVNGTTPYHQLSFWIRRGGSAPSLTWTFTSSFRAILLQAFSGAATSGDPWSFAAATARDDRVDRTWSNNSGTTLDANELLTWVGAGDNVAGAGTQPTGFNERVDASVGFEAADKAQAAAGGTGTISGALYAAGSVDATSNVLAGLRPPSASTQSAFFMPARVPSNQVGPQVLRMLWRGPGFAPYTVPGGNRRRRVICTKS